ncbi:MAG: HAMP domain-containing histidine kinase, partial [Lachnospiraceae bacterium]|nr:HAMP domain-containing histidine kinase [Lachnospiraceae bacterium]
MNSRAQIKLKTKMMILFLAIILVPLMCTVLVFLGFGYYENIDMLQELSKKDIMIGAIVNRRLLKYMLVAMSAILIFTSAVITAWLNRDVYRPLKELSVAMQHISIGDFDYHMNGGRGDEIGVLFNNYEQMRLQLKESEEEKAQNEKKSKELVSNISHDLKTPITSIKGYVEGIMDGVANTPEKMDKYIKTIYNKANDMDRLINELTTYSGIGSNKIPYHFNILNVTEYFSDCVEEVGLDLESENIHLNFTNLLSADTCVVADPEQIKKVINNVISNSVKYMDHENGEIDIRLLDEGESVKIEIEDDGKGIASKDIGSIFERFYRTDASRNSLQGG